MITGKPLSEVSSNGGQSRGSPTERSSCAVSNEELSVESATGGGACAGETDSLHSAGSGLTQVMTSASRSQSQPGMLGTNLANDSGICAVS